VRDRLVHRRTAVIKQIRGFLLERGITFAKGPANLRRQMPAILEEADQNLTPRLRNLIDHLWREWNQLSADIDKISEEIETIASSDAACQRLRQIPGVGPLVSTATVAAHAINVSRPAHIGDWCVKRLFATTIDKKAPTFGASLRGKTDHRTQQSCTQAFRLASYGSTVTECLSGVRLGHRRSGFVRPIL